MDGPWTQYQSTESGPWDKYTGPSDQGSSLGGVAKSLGVGLAQGVLGIAGLPADLAHLYAPNQNEPNPLGSEGLQKKVEQYTGEFYKPQGALEDTAAKIGQFAPAVIGGPETLGTRIATRAVAPAIGSEVAKQATEGTAAQPYAEAAAALLGGAGATAAARKFQELAAARTAAKALPTAQDLLTTGGNQFNQARDMNLIVKPDFATNTANDIRDALKGFDPEEQGAVFKAADRLEGLGTSAPGLPPVAVPMNDIENIRKQLSNLRMSMDAPTREAARKALDVLTKNQQAITAADVISGDAGAYSDLMQNAVANYGAGKRSNIVQGKQDLADLNAGTAGSGANFDNATRQAIKQLARPINNTNIPVAKRLGFNDAEVEAIKKAATGTMVGNTARYLGKAAPTGIVSAAMAGGAGHIAGGPIGAVALPAAGYIAKKIGDLSTKRAVAALDSLVRSRSPLAKEVASQLPAQIVTRLPSKTQRILRGLGFAAPVVHGLIENKPEPMQAAR